jgi:FtsH-binding integral membrane protein
MSYVAYRERFVAAADAPAAERTEFIRKTYLHLGGAVLAFGAVAALLVKSPFAPWMMQKLALSSYSWLLVLGAFMAVGWVAERWAQSGASRATQYLGLGLYVVAEAIIFVPILYFAAYFAGPDVLPSAGILTATVFGGLTAAVFITGKDFSFLSQALMVGGFAALGLIVVAVLFGLELGAIFAAAMVVLAAGYILYYTSNVLHHYPVDAHVAAALALFASVALLFWYVLRLVMALSGRD